MVIKKAKTPKPKTGIKIAQPPARRSYPPTIISKFYRTNPKNGQSYKTGVFHAESRNDGKIMIGFSFCNYHKGDKFNFVEGRLKRGFGNYVARERALKWHNCSVLFIGNIPEGTLGVSCVYIPNFAVKGFVQFLNRCDRYFAFYKETKGVIVYPNWVTRFKNTDAFKRYSKQPEPEEII